MGIRQLLIETSGRGGWVALAEDETVLGVARLDATRRQARDLAPGVAMLLADAGWTPRQIEGVVVSRGPGSYTGLRVGLMSAKTFAYAVGCPIYAVETFAVIARQAPLDARPLDVIADAQQQNVYTQRFDASGVAPLAIRSIDEWLSDLVPGQWATGPGLPALVSRLPPGISTPEESLWHPGPDALLMVGLARREGAGDDVFTAAPLYLRPSSAEQQWQRRRS